MHHVIRTARQDAKMATVAELQREVEIAREGLKNVDENIKKLTGRDPSEFRPAPGRRVSLKRDFAERSALARGFGPGNKRQDTQGRLWSRVVVTRTSQDGDRPSRRLDSDGEDEDEDTPKPTIQSSVVATTKAPLSLKREDIVKSDEKTKSRNRRMFGMLLGTLQRFKQDSACKTEKDVRREEIVKKLEIAETKEKEEVLSQKKELFTSRRAKQAELKKLEWKMELTALQEEWDEHGKKLCKYIKTKSKPHIHYIPAKHTDKTSKLLEESSRSAKRAMAERRAVIEEEFETQAEIEKTSKEEGNGESKGKEEVKEERESPVRDVGEEAEMENFEGESRSEGVVRETDGDTRHVIIKEDNDESMDTGEAN